MSKVKFQLAHYCKKMHLRLDKTHIIWSKSLDKVLQSQKATIESITTGSQHWMPYARSGVRLPLTSKASTEVSRSVLVVDLFVLIVALH